MFMIWEFLTKYLVFAFIAPWALIFLTGNFVEVTKALISLGLTLVGVVLIKQITDWPRPYIKFGLKAKLEDPPTDSSFPSGHTASSISLATSLFYVNPVWGVIGYGLAIILGTTRVVVKVHTLADVFVGGAWGILITIVVHSFLYQFR